MRLLLIFALGGLLLAGCRHASPADESPNEFKPKPAKTEKAATRQPSPPPAPATAKPVPRITPLNEFSGKVASVNSGLRFAVLEFFFTKVPSVDQRLSAYRQGQKVGELKITGPARDNNIVADITTGEIQPGDDVRSN